MAGQRLSDVQTIQTTLTYICEMCNNVQRMPTTDEHTTILARNDRQMLHAQLATLVDYACTTIEERLARVLNARARVSTRTCFGAPCLQDQFMDKLSVDEFVRVYRVLDTFVNECNSLRTTAAQHMHQRWPDDANGEPASIVRVDGGSADKCALNQSNINESLASMSVQPTSTSPLRIALRTHTSAFINHFHTEHKTKLT